MTVQVEHRCEVCNKIIRFQNIELAEGQPAPDLQVFDETCNRCCDEQQESNDDSFGWDVKGY